MKSIQLSVLVMLASCTALGPMPATTGISAIPTGRPGLEGQLGAVPAFFLSQSPQAKVGGRPVTQLSALLDLDRWLGVPGLFFGGRVFGQKGDTPVEPYLGYRRRLSDDLAVGGVVYGTSQRSSYQLASYRATRLGAELMADARLWAPARWFGVHAQATVAATRITASGTYCVDPGGYAIDCDTNDRSSNTMIDATLADVFPSGTLALAFDFGRRPSGAFHVARLALLAGGGSMPLVRAGEERGTVAYATLGLTLTLGLGARN